MVPFVKAIVPSVDIATGIVTITPPPGLLEELPEDPEDDDEADDRADDHPDDDVPSPEHDGA
jgi:16S rRNA processing protein RimM